MEDRSSTLVSAAEHAALSPPSASGDGGETRLRGRWLVVARIVISGALAMASVLYLAALPGLYPRLAVPCADALFNCAITPEQVAPLARLGLTPGSLATIFLILTCAAIALVTGVAAVLIWRRSNDWMALFLALTLFLLPSTYTPVLQGLPPALQGAGALVENGSLAAASLLLGIFPSGRFVPRWLWVPTLLLVLTDLVPLPAGLPLPAVLALVLTLVPQLLELVLIGGQVYRYRHIATPVQRQQIKWGVYALVLTILVNQGFWVPVILDQDLQRPESLYILLAGPDSILIIAILVAFFSVAILRYNLYDIDVLINRALVYGSLTAILAAVYVVGVVGSQTLVGGLTHAAGSAESPIVVVVTTLVIAALFRPLRRRLQAFVDRRFYRSKYDAERTLASFGQTLREQVDLPDLADHLLGVVHETMRPAQVFLWLRHSEHHEDQP